MEIEARESLWLKQKTQHKQRDLLKKLVSEMKTDPEFKNRFFQGILLPDKLTEDMLEKEDTGVKEVMNEMHD